MAIASTLKHHGNPPEKLQKSTISICKLLVCSDFNFFDRVMIFVMCFLVYWIALLVAHSAPARHLDQAQVAPLPARAPLLLAEPALERVWQVVAPEVNPLAEPQYRIEIWVHNTNCSVIQSGSWCSRSVHFMMLSWNWRLPYGVGRRRHCGLSKCDVLLGRSAINLVVTIQVLAFEDSSESTISCVKYVVSVRIANWYVLFTLFHYVVIYANKITR